MRTLVRRCAYERATSGELYFKTNLDFQRIARCLLLQGLYALVSS